MQYQWSRLYHVDDEGGLVDCDIYDGDYRDDGVMHFRFELGNHFFRNIWLRKTSDISARYQILYKM